MTNTAPAKTPAPPTPATATQTGRGRCWSRPWRSTSGSTPTATWPAPRRWRARRACAAVAAGRARPKSGWAALTPAEQAVAGLIADGLTNPQIGDRLYITRRTVQTHLVHVFAKLDIASRVQLAAQVTRHGHQEPPPGPATSTGPAR